MAILKSEDNFEIGTQFRNFQIAQRNFEIAQIYNSRGTYTCRTKEIVGNMDFSKQLYSGPVKMVFHCDNVEVDIPGNNLTGIASHFAKQFL